MEQKSHMITVTLNPAVDKTYTAESLILGQVNRMESVKNIAGGKGINVTKVLRQYEYPVTALGFFGGYGGRMIQDAMEDMGVRCRFTHVEGETRSSINILARDGYVTEILEPGPSIKEKELAAFLDVYERELERCCLVILSGSVPERVPADIYATLIKMAGERKVRVLLDSSGIPLREGVRACPYMVKPNRRELEFLLGRSLKNLEEIRAGAELLQKGGIPHVLVSMGEKGMLYLREGRCLYAKVPKIAAVNTVGCGDSAVAAFAMGLFMEKEGRAMLQSCAGISAANAYSLENAVIPKEKAKEIMEKVEITEW